jgi:hypothetical protein
MKILTVVLVAVLTLTGCAGVNGEPLLDTIKAEALEQAEAQVPQVDLLNEQRAAYYNGAFDTCMYHNMMVFVQEKQRKATPAEVDAAMQGCDQFAWTVIEALGVKLYGDEPAPQVAPQRAPAKPEYKCLECQNA